VSSQQSDAGAEALREEVDFLQKRFKEAD